MRIRYVPADPAGNLTALALTPVPAADRADVGARLMRAADVEQAAFIDEGSLFSPLPRMDMMGGEFCGNATRAFALYAARRRGLGEHALRVSVSGARAPVRVTLDAARGRAFAHMPPPAALEEIAVAGRRVPVVRMEGIAHAALLEEPPSGALAEAVLAAMSREDAQGVLFARGQTVTPFVCVPATGTRVWESSCGSGSVALAWLLSRGLPDGEHAFAFTEPGGVIEVRVTLRAGRACRIEMGGAVTLGEEREVEV